MRSQKHTLAVHMRTAIFKYVDAPLKTMDWIQSILFILVVAGIGSFSIGLVTGYALCKLKQRKKQYGI